MCELDELRDHLENGNIVQFNETLLAYRNDFDEQLTLADVTIENQDLTGITLSNIQFENLTLEKVTLNDAFLINTDLKSACFIGGSFCRTNFGGSNLSQANLEGCIFDDTSFDNSDCTGTTFTGCEFLRTSAKKTMLTATTLFDSCNFFESDFRGSPLDAPRFFPPIHRDHVKYFSRKQSWLESIRLDQGSKRISRKLWSFACWLFLFSCDYGRSTKRIVKSYTLIAIAFASVYLASELLHTPFLTGLSDPTIEELGWWEGCLMVSRALYFSIVTMTTLGFGDIKANLSNPIGMFVVCLQTLLGYVLLGAIVTRLGVLFQASAKA